MAGRGALVTCVAAMLGNCSPSTDAQVAGPPTAVVTSARVSTWRDDARAAYSLIHDDLCAGAEGILGHAVPELRARGLRAGLAAVAGSCDGDGTAPALAGLAAEGFEIVNHSYSHPHVTPELAPLEIEEARRLLESYTGQPVTFYAFPFDDYTDATIALVAASGHVGARAGGGGLNAQDLPDPLRLRFEAYGPYSSFGTGAASLDRYVEAAVAAGGWAVRECHGVADRSWEPVPLEGYRAHLDAVRRLVDAHQLWMAPPSAVVRYVLARQRCGAPQLDGARIGFAESAACAATQSELTLILSVSGEASGIVVRAGGRELPVRRKSAGEWVVTVDPRVPCEVSFF